MIERMDDMIEVPVRVVMVYAKCPRCGGKMVRSSFLTRLTHPPTYDHQCQDCSHKEAFYTEYPAVEYRAIEENL